MELSVWLAMHRTPTHPQEDGSLLGASGLTSLMARYAHSRSYWKPHWPFTAKRSYTDGLLHWSNDQVLVLELPMLGVVVVVVVGCACVCNPLPQFPFITATPPP